MYPAYVLCHLLSRLVLRAAFAINSIHNETMISFSSALKLFQDSLGGKINNILFEWPDIRKHLYDRIL